MTALWDLLLESQDSPGGVPTSMVEAKKEELRRAKESDQRVIDERDRRMRLDEIRDRERHERSDRGGAGRGRGKGRGRGRGGYEGGGRGRDPRNGGVRPIHITHLPTLIDCYRALASRPSIFSFATTSSPSLRVWISI